MYGFELASPKVLFTFFNDLMKQLLLINKLKTKQSIGRILWAAAQEKTCLPKGVSSGMLNLPRRSQRESVRQCLMCFFVAWNLPQEAFNCGPVLMMQINRLERILKLTFPLLMGGWMWLKVEIFSLNLDAKGLNQPTKVTRTVKNIKSPLNSTKKSYVFLNFTSG